MSLDKVHLPSGLQKLTLGQGFTQSLQEVNLPSGLVIVALGF
jgi:hypothetical protein